MTRVDAVLSIVLAVVDCLRQKRTAGKEREIRRDVERFTKAVAQGDTDTISRMLERVGRNGS